MKELLHQAFKGYFRRFPVNKGKERLLNRFWRPLSFGNTRRATRLKQREISVECDLTKWVQRHLYFFGEYEPENCRHWSRIAAKADVIFDVGANVGIYSLTAAVANPKAVIHAFEPTPELLDALVANAKRNSLTNIIAHPEAVGAESGTAYLRRLTGSTGANEGMNYITATQSPNSQLPVSKVSLADFCRAHSIERIDLLKIDIEGGEYDALRGAGNLVTEGRIRCIFLELCEFTAERSGHSTREILDLLWQAGYRIFQITRAGFRGFDPAKTIPDNVVAFAGEPDETEF